MARNPKEIKQQLDPVFHSSNLPDFSLTEPLGWYFWLEDWKDYQGPYISEEAARSALEEYCTQQTEKRRS